MNRSLHILVIFLSFCALSFGKNDEKSQHEIASPMTWRKAVLERISLACLFGSLAPVMMANKKSGPAKILLLTSAGLIGEELYHQISTHGIKLTWDNFYKFFSKSNDF